MKILACEFLEIKNSLPSTMASVGRSGEIFFEPRGGGLGIELIHLETKIFDVT
jgi:hypothetical protein